MLHNSLIINKADIPRMSFDVATLVSSPSGVSNGVLVVTRCRMYTRAHARTHVRTRAGVRDAIGRAGGVSNKLTADISVVYPAPLPSGSTSQLRASGPARERSRGEANIQRARARASAYPRGREIIFATYLQTE